jgi:hypothetical protein
LRNGCSASSPTWSGITQRWRTYADPADVEAKRDTALEFRVAIDLVRSCSVEPRFVEEQTPGRGERYIDDLDPSDFWKLADEINKLWAATRKREAAEIGPLSRPAEGG